MENTTLISKFSALSVELQGELLDFLEYLNIKQQKSQVIHSTTTEPLVFGELKGNFKMSEDFNEPLEDFKEYMQ